MKDYKTDGRIRALVDRIVENYDGELLPMGEPGYDYPYLIIANWNNRQIRAHGITLEKHGYLNGFSDEWTDIGGKAYRTSPDGHDWQPQWVITDGCEMTLKADIRQSFSMAQGYIEALINDPRTADTIGLDLYLCQLGFKRVEHEYESGLREGCNDQPGAVYDTLKATHDVVFQVVRSGDPWVTPWRVWKRLKTHEVDDSLEDVHVCFVHTKLTPNDVVAVFRNVWWNDDLLASYEHHGQHSGFSPKIFDDITNNTPIYGSGKEDFWYAINPDDHITTLMPLVMELKSVGYIVSVTQCPEKATTKPHWKTTLTNKTERM